MAAGINDQGEIVGYYLGADRRQHGFLFNGISYSTTDYPVKNDTVLSGINNDGEIVGSASGTPIPPPGVPEPTSILLLGTCSLGIGCLLRKKRSLI